MNRIISFAALFLLLFALAASTSAQHKISGEWNGYIDINGTHLEIISRFHDDAKQFSGTIDIPQQGGYNIPLRNISVNNPDSVSFDLMAGMSLAKFRGTFESDTSITGSFFQNGRRFPFQLTKSEQSTISKKPHLAKCINKELIIDNDSMSIGGTLSTPEEAPGNTLVIIISGSGAQNRDGALPITGFKPYSALADSLCNNNITSFRFDDRGIGMSGGNFSDATLQTLSSDVDAIINYFSEKYAPAFSKIVLLGHSQGGIVAGYAAARNSKVDNLVLMASPGVSLQKVLRFQVRQAFKKAGIDSSLIEKEVNAREILMHAVTNNEGVDQAKQEYREIFRKVQISVGMDSARAQKLSETQANQLAAAFQSPQMKSLLFYDPTRDLKKLDIPVLVLFGGKDTQVPIDQNKAPIESALKSAGVFHQTEIFENANHLFQKAETGSVQEYATLESAFVEDFISTITAWIK